MTRILLTIAFAAGAQGAAALSVTPDVDAATLAQAVAGVDVTVSGAALSAFAGASGAFAGGGVSGLGAETGALLSTGRAVDALGPNDDVAISTDLGAPDAGDDVTALILDISTATGDLFVDYIFASDEYTEFVGFSFEGPAITLDGGPNAAVTPGGDPVTVSSVSGVSNALLFVPNEPTGGAPAPFNLQYDGFSTVLTARFTGLTIGQIYTLRIAVAEDFDDLVDSALFIPRGGVRGGVPPIVEPIPVGPALPMLAAAMAGLAVAGGGLRRRR